MTGGQGAEPAPAVGLGLDSPTGVAVPARRNGRYDSGKRRRSVRHGREGGCWVYIAAEELDKTGHGGGKPQPWYRVWGNARGRVAVQLYRER